ncbi:hypothetical protein D3C86_2140910 [compost metagenome]
MCNDADHIDQRAELRAELVKIARKFGIELVAELGGDPRGNVMRLHLPDQSWNTMGGVESGFAIIH